MIEYRRFISRAMLRAEPDALFVFGDNFQRRGLGGQAREMRGEPNAVGIPTKRLPSMRAGAFLTDADYEAWMRETEVQRALLQTHVRNGKIVWPLDGIGTGLARLQQTAPRIWAELEAFRKSLEAARK